MHFTWIRPELFKTLNFFIEGFQANNSGHSTRSYGWVQNKYRWVSHIWMAFNLLAISTGERPFIDILQDRRYWVIHLITIPSLFLAGVIFILSGFVYKLFGVANFMRYFYNVPINTQISLINDRFSIFLFIEDV